VVSKLDVVLAAIIACNALSLATANDKWSSALAGFSIGFATATMVFGYVMRVVGRVLSEVLGELVEKLQG